MFKTMFSIPISNGSQVRMVRMNKGLKRVPEEVYSFYVNGGMWGFLHTECCFACFIIRTGVSEDNAVGFVKNKQIYYRHLS